MAIEIKFEDFDTVCYSKQHNIIQLIEKCVALGVEVNITIDLANKANQAAQDAKDAATAADDLASANRNSITQLQTNLSRVDGNIDTLQTNLNTFSYAVTQDLQNLSNRISELEGKVG